MTDTMQPAPAWLAEKAAPLPPPARSQRRQALVFGVGGGVLCLLVVVCPGSAKKSVRVGWRDLLRSALCVVVMFGEGTGLRRPQPAISLSVSSRGDSLHIGGGVPASVRAQPRMPAR
jgi:hypothetical protein